MISTEINSNDAIVRFDQIVVHKGDQENRNPQDVLAHQDQIQAQKTQIYEISHQSLDDEQLKIKEKLRIERIVNIPNTIKRQLPTIDEVPDQSISISPKLSDLKQKDFLYEFEEQNQELSLKRSNQQKQQKKKCKKKKKKQHNTLNSHQFFHFPHLEYQQNMNIVLYFRDPRIDCNWKLLFSYFALIISSNLILQTLEVTRYSFSDCKLQGLDNVFVYLNQLLYLFGKIGILSLNYQEFTNTSSTKSNIPLLNNSLFSSIFTVLSMPLYVYDFILCQPRNKLFTLNSSLLILNYLDWFIISIMAIVIILHSIIKISIKKKTWKRLKNLLKYFYYILLFFVHILQVLVTFTQSTSYFLPAMLMESLYIYFSFFTTVYLSIRKFFFNKEPFLIKNELLQNQTSQMNKKDKFNNEMNSQKLLNNCSNNLKERMKSSQFSSSSPSIQSIQTNIISRKE
ncbi:unnamed protein product [Paramecium sonneborni]|uniref:Transmembrane protein n=1 Tax=Paramecium sonneborni TaxID=65129 RepID=A0A8S1NS20_9CILI|nr:unnamed protein product [Paramecium sonneborni]